jgi:DNA-binding beta-propeller fold protein YncE
MRFLTLAALLAAICASSLTVAGQIYWVDPNSDKIQRSNLDGTGVEDLITTSIPQSIDLDLVGCKIYWGTIADVRRADLDGTSEQVLAATPDADYTLGIAVDNAGGKVYWIVNDFDEIRRANLDGTAQELLFTIPPVFDPSISLGLGDLDLDVAAGKMYFTNFIAGTIQRANMDGSGGVEDILTGLTAPSAIAVDSAGGKFYWGDSGKIQRANLDGSSPEELVTGLASVGGLALDLSEGKIYWTNPGDAKIQRADLDGSNVEDVISSGLGTPGGLAIRATGQDDCDMIIMPSTSSHGLLVLLLLLLTALTVIPIWRKRSAA